MHLEMKNRIAFGFNRQIHKDSKGLIFLTQKEAQR